MRLHVRPDDLAANRSALRASGRAGAWQPAVVYVARGSAALWDSPADHPSSARPLLGQTRADLLLRLDTPASTTQLCTLTGHALSARG